MHSSPSASSRHAEAGCTSVSASRSLVVKHSGLALLSQVIPHPMIRTGVPSGGVAEAIPGARLVLFDGMAHDLPEALWDDIVGELKSNFAA